MNQSKIMRDGLLLIVIYILLLLMVMFIPFLMILFFIVLPIPFVLFTSRYNWQYGLSMLVISLCIAFFIGTYYSLFITLTFGIGGVVLGESIYNKQRAYETWAKGTLGFITGLLIVFLISHLVLNINWMDEIDFIVESNIEFIKSMLNPELLQAVLSEAQIDYEETVDTFINLFEEQALILKSSLPAILAIVSIFLAFISQWFSYKLLNWIDKRQLYFPTFKHLNFPKAVIWFHLLAMIFVMFNQDMDSLSYFVFVNVLALTSLFIIIQGFSFIFFYADHKKVHIVFPILVVIISLIFSPIFMMIIRIIGIIDLGFSLKARLSNN